MSPCYIQTLTPDGLKSVSYTADSLADAAHYEPRDGVYTVTNTYQTFKVLKLDAHLDRLENSARLEHIPLILNRPVLRAALRTMIAAAGYGDVRFRITVPQTQPDHLILSIEPFSPPAAEVYERGVRCITVADSTRQNPAAKTTDWMHDRENVQLPQGIYTGLLVDQDGDILEGVSSNFYAVLNGELRTAGEGVLAGIAQQIVFEIAPPILPLHKKAVNVRELHQLSEAFVTSSSRGIVPVIEIDGTTIGDGVPGVYTRALRTAYIAWVESHLEEL